MKTTGNFFAVREDDIVHIYRNKPKTTRVRQSVYDWTTGKTTSRLEQQVDNNDVYSLFSDTFKALTGRIAPRNKIVELEVLAEPKGKVNKTVFAARDGSGYVSLYAHKPAIEKVVDANASVWVEGEGYVTMPETKRVITPANGEGSIDAFCSRGFRQGVGLLPPKYKVTPLGVRVKNVFDIPVVKSDSANA